MAKYSSGASVFTVFLILSLMLSMSMSSQARILQRGRAMERNSESQLLLQELGFDLLKVKHYRKMSTRGPGSDRVSPGFEKGLARLLVMGLRSNGVVVFNFDTCAYTLIKATSEGKAYYGKVLVVTDLEGLQESITTFVRAVYVFANDLTKPTTATPFAHLDATIVLLRNFFVKAKFNTVLAIASGMKELKHAEDVFMHHNWKRAGKSTAQCTYPYGTSSRGISDCFSYSEVLSTCILVVEQCKVLEMGSCFGVAATYSSPPHFSHVC
ncbi:ATP synthase subunit beta, mitochondrial-like [Durio zibethinus]|uniref:ATP synthase subunit beta, mitochondrial-like n=1 Tax=Durio zibethinus TaxID=66656 RepID=A0A6P5YMT7_DURZI|nr:ATP synthase subunit beta, mitochondrial-like [Durio zibethinus]